MGSSWQSRLQAKDNIIAQKLADNSITLAGYATDVIFIRQNLNKVSDPTSITIDDVDVINIMFPSLEDVPMRRFLWNDTQQFYVANDKVEEEDQPFEAYAPVAYRIEQGSIILKFFDNPTGGTPNGTTPTSEMPWVLPLKVADVLGTFGGRSMIYQKLSLVYEDHMIPDQILQWSIQLAQRRQIIGY